MKMFLMEIITGDGQTAVIHGHTPYSHLAHKWARDHTGDASVRVLGPETTYMNRNTSRSARVTEVNEYQHEIKS